MSELLPPDLPRLRVLETALRLALTRVQVAIAAAEQREREAAAVPRWWVQWWRRNHTLPPAGTLHRDGCWFPGRPNLTAEQARAVLAEHGERVEMCPACQPRPPVAPTAPPVSPG